MARRLLLLAFLLAGRVRAEDAGQALYARYCASCHGRTGQGDGPVAASLQHKPTDLTRLAANAGGTFRFADVAEAIDGTRTLRAHGVSDMPVWGEVFQTDAASPIERQLQAAGRVIVITRYLRTLQQPTP